jgi:coenzyme F420-reducing hydrogenase delta subunit/ferredoxin
LLSAYAVWLLALALTVLLALMPLWPVSSGTKPVGKPAQVDLANCNGCSRCAADCPFGAIAMVARTDRRHHSRQAAVTADMCAACGICVGSCPSSTPFRRIEDIVSGIELPDTPVAVLRQQLQKTLALLTDSPKIVLFSCQQAAAWSALADTATAVLPLECAAMLPPSFVEYAVRLGADGVVIAGCREGDCEFRLGDRWVQERFTGAREPRLRAAAPRERIAVVWAGSDRESVSQTLATLRARLRSSAAPDSAALELLYDEQHD